MIAKKALELLNDVEFSEKYQGVQEYTEMLIVCKEALEKQIPEKPLNLCGRYFGKAKGGNCPCCGAQTNSSTYTYCRKCGQKLLWERKQWLMQTDVFVAGRRSRRDGCVKFERREKNA